MPYAGPRWLPGGHLQTIWAALQGRRQPMQASAYRRERWTTPDQDFIDVDRLEGRGGTAKSGTLWVMFHGLEGSSQSHYARAFAAHATEHGHAFAVVHFRGCSGEINWAPRAYHSGDYEEVDWILQRFRREHIGPIFAIGVSLGGNALLRWAQEAGQSAEKIVNAVATLCAPIDLAAGGWALGRGFNRHVYTPMFLRTMKPKALIKLQQYPGLFDRHALENARNLYDFDNVFTAPLHGFRNTDDYWQRASAKPHLKALQLPTLVLHARNDPFVPDWSLPKQQDVGAHVTLWQPAQGGHIGFIQGPPPGSLHYLPDMVDAWMQQYIG